MCLMACLAVGLALLPVGLAWADPPRRLLILGQGPDGHPAGTHEYMAGARVMAACLQPVKEVQVIVAQADGLWREGPQALKDADGVVLFLSEGASWVDREPLRRQAFADFAARGGGLVVLHWGMGTKAPEPIDRYLKLFGGCHGGPDRKYQVVESTVTPADPRHPITAGIVEFPVRDEFYYKLKFAKADRAVQPILRTPIDGNAETIAWCWERPDNGRSFGFSGLHFHENWKQEPYRRLMTQGILWSLKLPVPEKGINVQIPDKSYELQATSP